MKACVTGGTGFIGKRLVSALIDQGYEVSILSRKRPTKDSRKISYIQADLTVDSERLVDFVKDCDVLFHCAGEIKSMEQMWLLHVGGTKRLIEAVKKNKNSQGKKIHWVQLSSVGAYGPDQRVKKNSMRVVDESTSPSPAGEYEVSKTISDENVIFSGESGTFSYSIVRPSNVFGKGMPNQSIRSIISIIKRGLFFYIGKTNAISTYVHVDDVVDCLVACAVNERARGQVFNVSNDCSQENFVNAIADCANVSRPKIRVPEWLVRTTIKTFGKLIPLPLNEDRINALRNMTTYPSDKVKNLLGVCPRRSVTVYIDELVNEG